ncbi:MAG: hypothetical protein V3T22_06040, partial [Planctomycetota bacterium]
MKACTQAALLLAVPLALSPPHEPFAALQERLSRKVQEGLVRDYTALSGHTLEERDEQERIL